MRHSTPRLLLHLYPTASHVHSSHFKVPLVAGRASMCQRDSRTAALLPGSRGSGGAVDPKNFPLWPFRRFNRNVVLTWIISLLQGCGDSIWNGTVLAAFIYVPAPESNW